MGTSRGRNDTDDAFRIVDVDVDVDADDTDDRRARRFRVEIPEDCAYFRGHFPGRPVLPAVAQLALLGRLIRRAGHPAAWITDVDVLRLRRPLTPGQTIEVELRPVVPGAPLEFEIRSRDGSVTRGSLRFTTEASR